VWVWVGVDVGVGVRGWVWVWELVGDCVQLREYLIGTNKGPRRAADGPPLKSRISAPGLGVVPDVVLASRGM
jgi:hypothetical protein